MSQRPNFSNAKMAAERLLRSLHEPSRRNGRVRAEQLPDHVGPCTWAFHWDDQVPLYEFSLLQGDSGRPSGYVVASPTEALPPILEFSLEGPTYSQRLNAYLHQSLAQRNLSCRDVTWYYWTPFEPVAMVRLHGENGVRYFRVPELTELSLEQPLPVVRYPETQWAPESLAGQWDAVGGGSNAVLMAEEGGSRIGGGPTYYQQNCRSQLREDGSVVDQTTYCSPKCIAGCSPVAFGMLASCCKGDNVRNRGSKIWPGSRTWYLDWPSFADPDNDPSRSPEVSDTIWQFHSLMETSCAGMTSTSRFATAANRVFRETWGISEYTVRIENDPGYEFCQNLINRANKAPFVFSGFGQWHSFLRAMSVKVPFQLEEAGHSTVCWGWQYWADEGPPKLYVGLGWGELFGSKYVDFTSFTGRSACYVDY